MFKVKGTQLLVDQLDLYVRRAEQMYVEQYRKLIWETLKELVMTTPQWSGHAAANWNLGIGHPDTAVHEDGPTLQSGAEPVERGHPAAWRLVSARYGGGPGSAFMKTIQRGTKVYFTNSVVGDRGGRGPNARDLVLYLAEYQNPAWHHRLRAVNQPYETAEMVIQRMDAKWRKRPVGKGQRRGLGFGRMDGNSFNAEFA